MMFRLKTAKSQMLTVITGLEHGVSNAERAHVIPKAPFRGHETCTGEGGGHNNSILIR